MSDAESAAPGPAPTDVREGLVEGYMDYGYIRCQACHNKVIDLSGADSVEEAVHVWNTHVRDEHDGGING